MAKPEQELTGEEKLDKIIERKISENEALKELLSKLNREMKSNSKKNSIK